MSGTLAVLVVYGAYALTLGRKTCRHCRSRIPRKATVCRSCGRDV
jgi:ribosomal protein L40E